MSIDSCVCKCVSTHANDNSAGINTLCTLTMMLDEINRQYPIDIHHDFVQRSDIFVYSREPKIRIWVEIMYHRLDYENAVIHFLGQLLFSWNCSFHV